MLTKPGRTTSAAPRAETGWARSRRLREQPIRTCVRATFDGDTGQKPPAEDSYIVRGED
ncbi:hypothetical protein ACIQNG_08000 [Streptomyces sp. NPDC091377]|uniref:hypothetical protein n=1 Tax=unclassified Streptomyces TaxID=2593676 RepID=UPI00381A20BC